MAGNGWVWLECLKNGGNGWTWMEMDGMAVKGGNEDGQKQQKVTGNGWNGGKWLGKGLEMAGMDENGLNHQKIFEMDANGWNG